MQKMQKLFNNRKVFYSVIIVLTLLFGVFSFLTIKSYSNKEEPKTKEKVLERETFTTYISDGNGHYKKYTSADGSLYPSGYKYNQGISYCEDLDGNRLDIVPTYANNKFTLESDKTAFCYLYFDIISPAAEELVANGELWSSGLEGDGYRYVGTGATCSYDDGNYTTTSTFECPSLYNVTRTSISGETTNYTYQDSCPSNTTAYTYSCTELTGTFVDSSNVPNNFICFGTTDATECKNDEAKYMYRIIGVFEGIDGEQHLKLIKYKQLSLIKSWHSDTKTDTDWVDSDMYTGLNGEYFLTNTTYDYLQNSTWLNKIEDWTWSAVNTKTRSDSGPDYGNSLTPSEIYLHEMNRSSKSSSIGEWTTPVAKIGLMYFSDYTLSLGSSALSITGSIADNYVTLETGWMYPTNNDITASRSEWTISRNGLYETENFAWLVSRWWYSPSSSTNFLEGMRPVFYLNSDLVIDSGSGEYSNPYILRMW